MEGPRRGTRKHREIGFIKPCMMCDASLRGNRIKTTKTIMRWAITYENARITAGRIFMRGVVTQTGNTRQPKGWKDIY
jgi:hypothetical protein